MREAFDRLGGVLRGEMQTFAVDQRGEIQASAAQRAPTSRTGFRLPLSVALLSQRVDRGFAEQAGRVDGLDGRVLRLEMLVTDPEDGRKPRRPRRRR
jgi:hypothetical protein